MEGLLYKWTNYLSGWQPRWFVLEGGTLSYYDSQEDAWKGCKGSITISVCEIQVHSTDITRMDLIIPGEQYFYLKSINAAERQKWLVALGTTKACLTDNRTKKEKELHENTEVLKTKMSELRLYCDLLLQQVNKIKESSAAGAVNIATEEPDNLDMGALVKSTCSTFLKTLEECMQIANRTFSAELLHQTPPGSPHMAAIKANRMKPLNSSSHPSGITEKKKELNNNRKAAPEKSRAPGQGKNIFVEISEHHDSGIAEDSQNQLTSSCMMEGDHTDNEEFEDAPCEGSAESKGADGPGEESEQVQRETCLEQEGGLPPLQEKQEEPKVDTFFSTMNHRFSDITLEEDNGIPTEPFLESCYAIVPVLDKLGPTVFAPVKIDFVGNIKKINQKYITDPQRFTTLQKIVLYEVDTNVAQVRNSATEALLWLKRGLKFLKEFLSEVNRGEKDIHTALNNAYGKTLRQYHGWVVRGVFALALRAAPSYEGFAAALVSIEGDELKKGFPEGMHRDLDVYLPAMENQLAILDAMYDEYSLDSDEIV
ncbi:pleckstrin homology domain-containing family A member 8 isoform X1 [Lepisosteus oculatus]|uniref:pleckstrin homology domain-containing family A member 8 isoform X1 n=2 Tax=Lepisosteus oculatus TaxID=7918 RepID=UPI0035F50B90